MERGSRSWIWRPARRSLVWWPARPKGAAGGPFVLGGRCVSVSHKGTVMGAPFERKALLSMTITFKSS